MLQTGDVGQRALDSYRSVAPDSILDRLPHSVARTRITEGAVDPRRPAFQNAGSWNRGDALPELRRGVESPPWPSAPRSMKGVIRYGRAREEHASAGRLHRNDKAYSPSFRMPVAALGESKLRR